MKVQILLDLCTKNPLRCPKKTSPSALNLARRIDAKVLDLGNLASFLQSPPAQLYIAAMCGCRESCQEAGMMTQRLLPMPGETRLRGANLGVLPPAAERVRQSQMRRPHAVPPGALVGARRDHPPHTPDTAPLRTAAAVYAALEMAAWPSDPACRPACQIHTLTQCSAESCAFPGLRACCPALGDRAGAGRARGSC